METLIIILLLVLVASIGYVIFLFSKKTETGESGDKIAILEREKMNILEEKIRLEADFNKNKEEFGRIKEELKQITTERDNFQGKSKQLYIENERLLKDKQYIEKENAELRTKTTKQEAEDTRKQKEFEERINKLSHAEKALEDERQRIRREDEAAQASILEEQNRIWNDHETLILARLRETCQKSSLGFTFHDNTNLPAEFTKLKPDFMVNFLGQYIIFDAKKSKSIKTYIPDQVKSTAKKYKDIPDIYPTVFFVVPADEIADLKTLSFIEEGFSFFIISSDAIEPILANFKKISEYDTIKDFDPQDRETIVNLIANYDRHISLQNATNILFTKESITLMNSKESLHEELQSEITIRKQGMRSKKLNDADIKKIAQSPDEQAREITKLVSPRIAIAREEIEEMQGILDMG
ncbi:MAG: hypothetical protein Q8K26_00300 [Candidatus Gracilibacteria bacterium]|nr:hypothetical protein [Candidatus Gracilibacteria bacterium]